MDQGAELLQDEMPGAGAFGVAGSRDRAVSGGDAGSVTEAMGSGGDALVSTDQGSLAPELLGVGEAFAAGSSQTWAGNEVLPVLDADETIAAGSAQARAGDEASPVAEPLEAGKAFAAGSTQDWDDGEAASGGQLPRPLARGCLVMASLTLIVAMLAVAVTGFTGSTWNQSRHTMDREASAQLANLADAMTAAGAPRAAVLHVRAAAQPGLNRGAALEALAAAVQILAEAGDDPHLVPLRRQLHRAYLEIYEKEYGAPPTPDRQRPTVPSFEARNHFGFWILDFGVWIGEFGFWSLEPGSWVGGRRVARGWV
jgi:hypothetical protein